MIRANVDPVGHIPPRRRFDPSHPGRKEFISYFEWKQSGATRAPDPAIYEICINRDGWQLKDGI